MRTLFLLTALAATSVAQVRYEDILRGPADNWLTYAGDYQGQRHSSLKQITAANVGSLVPKWVYHIPKANGLRTNPIVYDGVMYVTGTNEVRALDARSGSLIWQYKDTRSKKEAVNRGAAILGDRVFFVTADIHLVALDRQTGAVLWEKKYGNTEDGLFATAAPLALKDQVLVGVAGGDTGMRGYIAALSPVERRRTVAHVHDSRQGRAGLRDLGQADRLWRRRNLALRYLRSRSQYALLDRGQSVAGLFRSGSRRRQSLLLLPARAGCRDRQDQVAFPVHAARHPRLGCPVVAGAGGSPFPRHRRANWSCTRTATAFFTFSTA